MATDLVHVSAASTEMIFTGNMYKAPPLDRKKRKKWHERHFVLRANRTLECYKSMKAAESNKAPRRIIDLRECISLEIGLEYRNYDHILSLGTFKRTFFFAAPSDALMLQWANVLEKTKNAQDGESIEVLDIGLRKTGGVPVVHRVKPSSPTHRFSVGSPKRHNVFNNKKVMSLGHFTRDSAETVNLRGSDQPVGSVNWADLQGVDPTSPERASSFSSSFENPNNAAEASPSPTKHPSRSRSKSPHHVPLKLRAQLSNGSRSSQSSQATSTTTENSQFERPLSLSSQQSFTVSPNHTSASQSHMISPAMLSSRVPPPSSIIAPAKRNEDGFFVTQKKHRGGGIEESDHAPKQEEGSGGSLSFRSKAKGTKRREFIIKDGALQRSRPGRNVVRSPRRRLPNEGRMGQNSPSPKHEATARDNLTTGSDFQSNLKRSFRYRMITLRAEKPIFIDKIRETSDSEDEEEESHGARKEKREPLPTLVTGSSVQTQDSDFSPRRRAKQEKRGEDAQKSAQPNQRLKAEPEPRDDNLIGQRRANSYSKLMVMGVKTQPSATTVMLPEHLSAHLNAKKRQRSSSQSDLLHPNKSQLIHNVTSLSQDDILMESTINDNAAAAQMLTGYPLDEADVFDILPARPPSDGFMYSSRTSLNSLDNILAPPDMFNEADRMTPGDHHYAELEISGTEPQTELELSRTNLSGKQSSATGLKRPVARVRSREANQPAVRQFHVGRMTIEPSHVTSTTVIHTSSKPLQLHKTDDTLDPNLVDRNSTESNDTGYTSGASPSYASGDKNSTQTGMQEFNLKFKDDIETISDIPPVSTPSEPPLIRDKGKLSSFDKQLSFQLSQTSITSTSSDYIRFYVPLIFYKPGSRLDRGKVIRKSLSPTTGGSNMFSLQVCLVEDSEDLIKDLMSVKSLEGYTIVECDEIEGSNNVSNVGDDFTVETALEDLEFGFTVIKSTQKDLFIRKVRQFHFEIQKLFGSSKPFSCDVVVRHADQITVLPIEVDMKA